ncbi:MAG: acylphosphatase [bacterium]|nr:acylphosphatase [bacterium]
MVKHLNITISGQVQGVWFRGSAKDQADKLSIKGLVKNLPNGSVHIEAEGNPEALEEFLRWCQKGPPLSQVSKVDTSPAKVRNYTEFNIL